MWQRVTVLLFLTLLSACQQGNDTAAHATTSEHPLLLQTVLVSQQAVPRYYSATGYTNIARTIEISTSQSGSIEKLLVNEGDTVKAGELLAVIDEAELATSIKQATDALNSAEINLKDRQQDLNTTSRLWQSQAIPAEQLRKAQVQLDLVKSQLAQANSELKRQQARKPYFRITSPIDARVVKRWVSQGDLAIVGKPLIQLEATQGLEFETALPAQWMAQVKVGDTYPVRLHDNSKPVTATVSHIVRSANRITQTCQIKLALADSDKLSAGLSGQVDFIIAEEQQLLIPEEALTQKAGVQGVFRVEGQNRAQFTPVQTERRWQQQRVILSGLESGETVVLNPPAVLRDGAPIELATAGSNEKH